MLISGPVYGAKPVLFRSGTCRTTLPLRCRKLEIEKKNINPQIRQKRSAIAVQCVVPAAERMVAALGYALPFFNGMQYGRSLMMQYPAVELVFRPLFPLVETYHSIPYASFVAFFGLYLGVVRNPAFSRYVRFNAMQAVVVDVLLALPMIFQRILSPSRGGPLLNLFLLAYSVLFLCIVFGFLYALVSCILGTTPTIPFVADAADAQL